MSELRVDKIVSSSGSGSVEFTQGINLPEGVVVSGIAQTAQSLTPNSNVNTSGIITASSFVGNFVGTATTTTNIPNLIGDITSNNTNTILATVNSDVGTFGSSTTIPSITVNAKGLVTGISTSAITVGDGTLTLGVSGTGLSGSQTFTANQSGNVTFTVTSNATSSNTSGTIVSRDGSGNFSAGTITAVDFNSTSDQSLKTNIQTVDHALDIVSDLRGVSFDWKETDKSSYGVIAQELEQVLPDLVGNGDIKTVNYNGIIGILIEAIKELKNEIDILKSINN